MSFIHALKEAPHVFGGRDSIAAAHLSQQAVRLPSERLPNLLPARRTLNFAAASVSPAFKSMALPQRSSAPLSARLQATPPQNHADVRSFVHQEVQAMVHRDYGRDANGTLDSIVTALPVPPMVKVLGLGVARFSPAFSKPLALTSEVNAARSMLMGTTRANVASRYHAVETMLEGVMVKNLQAKQKLRTAIDPVEIKKLTEAQKILEATALELNSVAMTLRQQQKVLLK